MGPAPEVRRALMRIAYIISAYQYPELLARLVTRLQADGTAFFIHVDRKTGEGVYRQMTSALSRYPNVHFLTRHTCQWGDFGHVRASLEGLNAIGRSGIAYDYTILLTGQDYPVKSNRQIADFLGANRGRSFLHHFRLPDPAWANDRGGLDRIAYWHFRLGGRPLAFPRPRAFRSPIASRLWSAAIRLFPAQRRFPAGFEPYGGSGYWCLTAASVDYLYRFAARNPAFVRFFKYVYIPDEIFFHTALLNSPLRDEFVNDDLRYARWPTPGSASPAVLRLGDFERLVTDKLHSLFARKFDLTVDSAILDRIDRELLGGEA